MTIVSGWQLSLTKQSPEFGFYVFTVISDHLKERDKCKGCIDHRFIMSTVWAEESP